MAGQAVGEVLSDSLHRLRVHQGQTCEELFAEAFYVIMAVKEDKTREVLGIYNNPEESASGWGETLKKIKGRGVEKIGLIVADGLKGLDTAVGDPFPNV